jgi:HNH endonuclease
MSRPVGSNAPGIPMCIYCRATGVTFNRDHVIPEAFGKFENNFVLTCVCESCNKFFGDELEIVLGRNSREAILRLHHGVKAPGGAAQLKYDNAELTVDEPGPWRGARIILTADPSGIRLDTRPLPQVAFKNEGETDWKWVPERELDEPSVADRYRDPRSQLQVVGSTQEDLERLTTKLAAIGINYNQKGLLPQPARSDGTILTRLASKVEDRIMRAIGKISGNYVAYVHGAAFFLRPDFDHHRSWVRYGTVPPWGVPVVVVATPILALDSLEWRQTTGHLVTFDWNRQGDGLFAQVSLFNDLNYKILTCLTYSGLVQDIRTGHHFDLRSRTITALAATALAS